jgi:histidinol-phosphate phosphatase family protein
MERVRRQPPSYDVVVPTVGRPSLGKLIVSFAQTAGPLPGRILLVDDRASAEGPLVPSPIPVGVASRVEVLRGRAAGPAAARNAGWKASGAEWIVFVDDDVVLEPDWLGALASDLEGLPDDVAASQGRIRVPVGRRPTDWERNVAGLERARWATADMAYRRSVLGTVGGFDERFPRAYREDADLGLRVVGAGYRILTGKRRVVHPVRPAGPWVSVRLQAGNADDVLMRVLHGKDWRARAGVPRGRYRRHLAVTGALAGAGAALALRRRKAAASLAAAWMAGTAELAWARIRPGPRMSHGPREVLTMLATSVLIPPTATAWSLHGLATVRRRLLAGARSPSVPAARSGTARRRPEAVFLDRDGTLVVDVPYNADPGRVVPVASARLALDRLREEGVAVAVVSNQSGIARGLLSASQVDAVNRRIEELVGPVDAWFVCPHGDHDGCSCRKPRPAMLTAAAHLLGVPPDRCALIGDTGADVQAALAVGARPMLVPTPVTRVEEVDAAPEVAPNLLAAVERLVGCR